MDSRLVYTLTLTGVNIEHRTKLFIKYCNQYALKLSTHGVRFYDPPVAQSAGQNEK